MMNQILLACDVGITDHLEIHIARAAVSLDFSVPGVCAGLFETRLEILHEAL